MEDISAHYKYDEAEAIRMTVEVSRATTGSLRSSTWLGVFFIISTLGVFFAHTASVVANWNFQAVAFLMGFGIFLVGLPLLSRCLIRSGAKRNFRANPSKGQDIKWMIDTKEFRCETDGSDSRFAWSKLVKILEVRDGFLLFIQPRLTHWIPKHAFATEDDIAGMRRLIQGSGIEFRRKL